MNLIAWRHPMPLQSAGRCIGRTDVPVDPRKAKRLAHRIRKRARREAWPRVVWSSPLRRCASVGEWLRRWGWRHRVDARLCEMDFGRWDGRCWDKIGATEVQAWCADFAHHAPGGGEPLSGLMARCEAFLAERHEAWPLYIVAHAGWINAARWLIEGRTPPFDAAQWPRALPYGCTVELGTDSSGGGVAPARI